MKINISEIYSKNISNLNLGMYPDIFKSLYTKKEQEMWEFTLELLKYNNQTKEYDESFIDEYLVKFHNLYLENCENKFSLQEWFNFLKTKK